MNLEQLITKKPDEKIVFMLRSHPIIFLGTLLLIGVLLAVPVGVYLLMTAIAPGLLAGPISRPIIVLVAGAYYLLAWLFFLSSFVDYYLDAWIVTNDRILNIEQRGLFSRTVSEMDLGKVQDVTSEVKGFVAFVFNFGHVYIQTAGEVERFVFENVHRPHEIRKQMLQLVEDDRKRQGEIKPPAGQ